MVAMVGPDSVEVRRGRNRSRKARGWYSRRGAILLVTPDHSALVVPNERRYSRLELVELIGAPFPAVETARCDYGGAVSPTTGWLSGRQLGTARAGLVAADR